jgi:hypothetical protein
VDLLCQAHLAPVATHTITGGETVINEAEHRSSGPKWSLVSNMQVLLAYRPAQVAVILPEAAMLVQERLAFQVKMTPRATTALVFGGRAATMTWSNPWPIMSAAPER